MKKKKKIPMHPTKTLHMQFHDKVAPMSACGESFMGFTEWLQKRDLKHPAKRRKG
jgi:hypothetical protein